MMRHRGSALRPILSGIQPLQLVRFMHQEPGREGREDQALDGLAQAICAEARQNRIAALRAQVQI
jgi:hypothetical protein